MPSFSRRLASSVFSPTTALVKVAACALAALTLCGSHASGQTTPTRPPLAHFGGGSNTHSNTGLIPSQNEHDHNDLHHGGGIAAGGVAGPMSKVHTGIDDGFLYETSTGRRLMFHGVNAVNKGFPWYPDWLKNETLLDEVASWGVNVMRFGWMFTGFQPTNASYFNHTYFEESRTIVRSLAARGIRVFLDAHQDCLSSKFCLYDGWPLWAIDQVRQPPHAFPYPYTGNCSTRGWMSNELTEAADVAYQSIYDNYNGLADTFAAFWKASAQLWKDEPSVLGYELINEPFAGDVYADPLLFLPGVAGSKNLMPLYDRIAAAIHAVDDVTPIFYEPVTWGMLFDGEVVGSGFTHVPGGPAYRNRSVLSYHYYCSSFGGNRELCRDVTTPLVFKAIAEDVSSIGGSSFLSEFGGCNDPSEPSQATCRDQMASADAAFQSWTEYDSFGQGDVSLASQAFFKRILTRPYPTATAGMPVPNSLAYNVTGMQEFKYCYVTDTSIAAPTEVFIPTRSVYPSGNVTVRVGSPTGPPAPHTLAHVSLDKAAQRLTISAVSNNVTICVVAWSG